jgi:hypothetical protein
MVVEQWRKLVCSARTTRTSVANQISIGDRPTEYVDNGLAFRKHIMLSQSRSVRKAPKAKNRAELEFYF